MIINGRKTGDLFGKNTSYQWNGKAVVDYTIASMEIFDDITFFKVGNYQGPRYGFESGGGGGHESRSDSLFTAGGFGGRCKLWLF